MNEMKDCWLVTGKVGWVLAFFLLADGALVCRAQSTGGYDPPQANTRPPDRPLTIDEQSVTQDQHRMHQLNLARQRSMVSDAEKLLALARQLDAGVGAAGNVLSPAQRLKMASDIEKLAHNVKEKMSYVAGTPSLAPMTHGPPGAWPQ